MWLTRFAIARPIIVAMFFIALAVAGTISYLTLGKNADPNVAFPIVIVVADYPGASPAEMERLIIKPIEDQLDGIEHLDQLTATAQDGEAVVIVQFKLHTDLDYAAIDVQRRVDTARVYMPTDLDPPQVIKNGADAPILTYVVDSKTMNASALADLVNDQVVPDIKQFPNVAGVDLGGVETREFQVDADPLRMYGTGITLDDLFGALQANNSNLPGGRIDKPTSETQVSVHADVNSAADIAAVPLVVPYQGGVKSTRIGDVATVVDGHQDQRQISLVNGHPGLIMDIDRTISADEVGTTAAVRRQMKILEARYPQITFHELFAPADFTQASLDGVLQSLLEGVVLTAIVLLVFLHAWRNAAVVMIAIPASLLATFCVMHVMGLTLDNVSLMGLSLIIGILVDDSIVVLENITRHRDLGQHPDEAAISGRSEIGGAAIAITLVDVVVFLPLAFLSGFVGEYMKEFGIVVTVATLFSLFVSFTLTPMLAAKWSVLRRSSAPPRILAGFQAGFDRLTAWYRGVALPLALRHRWMIFWLSGLFVVNAIALASPSGSAGMVGFGVVDLALALIPLAWMLIGPSLVGRRLLLGIRVSAASRRAALVGALVCCGAAVMQFGLAAAGDAIQSEFVPDFKVGQIALSVTYPTGTPLATTGAALERIDAAALKLPYVDTVRSVAGTKPDGWGSIDGGYVGKANVTLQQRYRRKQDDVVARLRAIVPQLAKGAVVTVSGRSASGSGLPISYTLSGPAGAIGPAAEKLAASIRAIPGTVNVQTSADTEAPHLDVIIDPQRCAVVGVSPGDAATAARIAMGGAVATRVRTWNKLVDVRLQYGAADRNSIDEIRRIAIRAVDGTHVPLGDVATFTFDRAPTKIEHFDRQVVIRVNGDIDRSKTTLGTVTQKIDAELKTPGFLPAGVTSQPQGDSQFFMEFLSSMGFALVTSIALIYCLMVVLYGSFVTPFVIMFSIPVAIIGALLLLAITHNTINLFSAIGLIMLFGLVAKNGILLVDYANTLRKRGMSAGEAILAAGGTRLRPIVMTTAAMVFGMIPLAAGLTEGGEIRSSMGIVLIGGLLSSLFLTLFLVPAMYATANRIAGWWGDARARSRERRPIDGLPAHVPAGVPGD